VREREREREGGYQKGMQDDSKKVQNDRPNNTDEDTRTNKPKKEKKNSIGLLT